MVAGSEVTKTCRNWLFNLSYHNSIVREARKAIIPFRVCIVLALVVVFVMLIVVFATRDTTTDQELSLKITELTAEISDLRAEMSGHINSKPVVKFEATRL